MRTLIKLLLVLACGYVAIVALIYVSQTWLIFPGASLPSHPIDGPLKPERLQLTVDGGDQLHGLLFRAAGGDTDLLIGFGGNAQDAEFLGHDLADDFPDLDVAVFHYRGYGPSTGKPSERALLADALSIHDHLIERLEPERVFAIGISLGSSVAAYLSKERRLDGVVLITPFDSIEAIGKATYWWLPVGWLLHHRFRSDTFMDGNPTPTAVIAAEHDAIVKPARTAALVERVGNLVFHTIIPGAQHNTIAEIPIYEERLNAAFAAVVEAADAGAQRGS